MLLIKRHPHFEESIPAYLHWHSTNNGFKSIRQMLSVPLKTDRSFSGSIHLLSNSTIGALLGVSNFHGFSTPSPYCRAGEFDRWAPMPKASILMRNTYALCRYCPACLRKTGYFSAHWDNANTNHCSRCNLVLNCMCGSCGAWLTLDRKNHMHCDCGWPLVAADHIKIWQALGCQCKDRQCIISNKREGKSLCSFRHNIRCRKCRYEWFEDISMNYYRRIKFGKHFSLLNCALVPAVQINMTGNFVHWIMQNSRSKTTVGENRSQIFRLANQQECKLMFADEFDKFVQLGLDEYAR